MTPRRIGLFLSLQDVLLTTTDAGADILIPVKGRTDALVGTNGYPTPHPGSSVVRVRGTVTVVTVTVDGLGFGPPIPSVTDDGWGVWATHTIRYG